MTVPVTQVHEIVNTMAAEITGKTDLVAKDLSNLVDVGKEIFDNTTTDGYVKSLTTVIARTVFKNRVYKGEMFSVMRDAWTYGLKVRKIKAERPQAIQNSTWELEDGQDYPVTIFYKPQVSEKFFESLTAFEVRLSFTEKQARMSFHNAAEMGGLVAMLENEVQKTLTLSFEGLLKATAANMIAETVWDAYGANPVPGQTSKRAINLLHLYHTKMQVGVAPENQLTVADAMRNPEFIRFAVLEMKNHVGRMKAMTTHYNIGGKERHTEEEYLHVVTLAEFNNAAQVYLQADTYNKEFTDFPQSEKISYWQAPGDDFDFADTSRILVEQTATGKENVEVPGIIGIMFDQDALGVTNKEGRVKTAVNELADFYTNAYKEEAGYYNDFDENFILFYIQ